MSNGQLWFVLIIVSVLIAGWALGYSAHEMSKQEHLQNMECISQGGTFGPINEDYAKLICKK